MSFYWYFIFSENSKVEGYTVTCTWRVHTQQEPKFAGNPSIILNITTMEEVHPGIICNSENKKQY